MEGQTSLLVFYLLDCDNPSCNFGCCGLLSIPIGANALSVIREEREREEWSYCTVSRPELAERN